MGNVEEEFSKWTRSLASVDTRCLQNMSVHRAVSIMGTSEEMGRI